MEPVNEIVEPDSAKILMRQTSYTLEECIEMLKTKTLEESIKDFLGIVEKKEETGSTNQKIFRSIREHF
jgi:type II secretory pathway component PulF